MNRYECPTCRRETVVVRCEDARFRPFCSERCKLIDLGRWMDGTYTVSEPVDPEEVNRSTPETGE